MRTIHVQACLAIAVGGALVAMSTAASAATASTPTEPAPSGLNTPPAGAGTAPPEGQQAVRVGGLRPGPEGGVGLGTGFSSTYSVGMEARVGYTFRDGIYGGAALQYFAGTSVNGNSNDATFVGGEIGYKVFATNRFEIRPYVFLGPSFITQVQGNPFFKDSNTSFAVQPSVLLMYHFGHAFVGGDGRWLVTPTPATFALFASGGISF
jgi:hypothetical protein